MSVNGSSTSVASLAGVTSAVRPATTAVGASVRHTSVSVAAAPIGSSVIVPAAAARPEVTASRNWLVTSVAERCRSGSSAAATGSTVSSAGSNWSTPSTTTTTTSSAPPAMTNRFLAREGAATSRSACTGPPRTSVPTRLTQHNTDADPVERPITLV